MKVIFKSKTERDIFIEALEFVLELAESAVSNKKSDSFNRQFQQRVITRVFRNMQTMDIEIKDEK